MHIPSVGDVPEIMRRRFWKSNCGSVLHSGRDSGTDYYVSHKYADRAPSGEKRDVILGTCGHPPLRVRWLGAQHIVFSWIWRRCWVKLHRSSAGDLPRGGVKSVRSRHCGAAGCSSVLKFARCLGRIPGILQSRPVSNRTRMYTRRRRSGGLLPPYLRTASPQSLSTASEVQAWRKSELHHLAASRRAKSLL